MKKQLWAVVSVLFISIWGINSVYAADNAVKFGVVDVQLIMQKSPQVKTLNEELQTKFKPRQEKLNAAKVSFQNEVSQFTKNQEIMKADEKDKLKNKLISDQQAYQKMVQSYQQDLAAQQGKDMQKFMTNLQNAVDSVAKKNQYTAILNRAAVPYMDKDMDVTAQVLAVMSDK